MDDHPLHRPGPVLAWEHDGAGLTARHETAVTRIEATAADILRVRFLPDGEPAPSRPWDPLLPLPAARLTVEQEDGALVLRTPLLTVRLDLAAGTLHPRTADGTIFAADIEAAGWRDMALSKTKLRHMPDPELPAGRPRTGVVLHKRLAPDEGCFGLGQRTGGLDRRHRRLTNWTIDRSSPGHGRGNDNMYQSHPVLLAARPGLAWGLYLHSSWYSVIDTGYREPERLTLMTLGGELDYFLFAGPTPAAVVEQLTRLTGRPALPPLWALGFHQSRWSYRSDAEVRAVARGFRERRIPLDAIHLDIDYMDGFRVFTWDRQRFPDPAATVAALHADDIRAVTIVDPGVKKEFGAGYAVADDGVAGDHFARRPDGELFSAYVWPGESLLPDFCRSATRRWWGDLHEGLVGIGIDGIWCDMNEPSIGDRPIGEPGRHDQPIPLAARQGDDGEALQAETHNLYGQLMVQATADALQRLRPQRRPWLLTRSGSIGIQRWSASWMGDNSSWWEHLAMSLPQLASMGLSGSAHVGVDIGGFYHHCPAELFARWIELGTFYPFMRNHTRQGTRPQEPWAFGPEVEALARRAIERRYRLLPYLYTLAHRAHHTGEPLLRPLLFDFPDEGRLHPIDDQVMIGPLLMIAPVCQPGIRRRLVELPPGTWYDLHSGRRVDDTADRGALITDAPLGRLPILVRGGAALTLGNVRQSTAEPLAELTIDGFPDQDEPRTWTLIEDAGDGHGYRNGELAETAITVHPLATGAAVEVGPRQGGYAPHPRDLLLRLHLPERPGTVRLDGHPADTWRWDAQQQAVEIRLSDDGQAHRLSS